MGRDLESLIGQLSCLLDQHGLVPCLFALAHALRGENDRLCPQSLPDEVKRLAAVREYLANQVSGLAAFWRIQVPGGPPR